MSVKSPYTTKTERGGYSAIVYKDGDLYVAEDDVGAVIKENSDAVTVIQAALDAIAARGGGKLVQLEGTYTWTTAVTYSANNLEWEGIGTVVNDCSAIVGTTGALKIEGAITGTNSALTVEAAKGQKDVAVTDASSFSAGDWIRIRSGATFNSGSYYLGELQKIASIAGNVITCKDVLAFTYSVTDTATANLVIVYENIKLRNLDFNGNYVTNWTGISLKLLHGVLCEGIVVKRAHQFAILIYDIVGFEMKGCLMEDVDQAGGGYGIGIYCACRDVLIHHNKFYNCRHGISCSGNGTVDDGIQTNQVYDSNVFRYSTQHASAMGSHNSYDGLVISNNVVMNDGLTEIPGLNTTVTGNTVYNDFCTNGAIFIQNYAKGVTIGGNVIGTHNQHGISMGTVSIHTTEDIIIKGNIIKVEGVGYAPITLRHGHVTNLIIDSNYLYSKDYECFFMSPFRTSQMISITNNIIKSDADIGIYMDLDTGYSIQNVNINGNIIETINTKTGIFIYCPSGMESKYIQIHGNKIINCLSGIILQNSEYFSIHDNEFVNTVTGIRFYATDPVNYYSIRDNHFIGCTTPIDDPVKGTGTVYEQHSNLFMDVLAVSATHVRSNEDLGEAIPNTFTIDAQPDVPRTLSGHFDAHAQITAYTIVITGIDAKGNTVTETKTEADGWDWETNNAFATITSIIMTERTGTGVGDTMDVGITDILGLSNIIYETGDVFKIKKDNANATVAAAQVNTTYDTYDMSVIGLAATNDFTIWYKSNLNMIS